MEIIFILVNIDIIKRDNFFKYLKDIDSKMC